MFYRYMFLALLVTAAPAKAEIYRCTDANGNPSFSDKPCGDDAKKVDVDIPDATGANMGGGDFSDVERGNAIRSADRKVGRIKEYIARLEREHSQKTAKINEKLRGLSSSKLDRSTRDKLLAEKRKASSAYRSKRSRAYRELGEARAERITSRIE